MGKGEALRDRTAEAIIESAAAVLAERGDAASMEEIANAAGVGRATLYRYFANRTEMLSAMADVGARELADRIREADLQTVPFEEAIARLARGIIATGSKYIALGTDGTRRTDSAEVIEPIRALFGRAIADGSLRRGHSPDLLMSLFSGLIRGAIEATRGHRLGIEEAASAVTDLFLRGVSAEPSPPRAKQERSAR